MYTTANSNVCVTQVWATEDEKQLSFIDDSTPSRVLISTRIRGLVRGAKEVQVELLTNESAVEMLCAMADLSADNLPPQFLSLIRLCGNLPLSISLCGGMLRSSKMHGSAHDADAIAEVLAMLQDDKAGALAEEMQGDTSALSVSELVIGRSVRCLSDTASRFFTVLGACPEDASIPFDFALMLWESDQVCGSESIHRSKSSVKKALGTLTLNNLLHRNGGWYSMHDIGNA